MLKLVFFLSVVSFSTHAAFLVKEVFHKNKLVKKEVQYVDQKVQFPLVLRDIPLHLPERGKASEEHYKETLLPDSSHSVLLESQENIFSKFPGSEVRTLIKQGPDKNRVIITVLGDGFTVAEKEKFFNTVQKIVSNIFEGETFKSYLPFFNVYAVFTPSKESGLTDRIEKNTVFGLYRSPVGSKRGIMPGNQRTIEDALKLAPAPASYPIIIANDPYYGGLGGRYAITTSSIRSASIVLRHELGHNFSNVGEEYDGGQVYRGANFSTRPSGSWDQWKEGDVNEKHESKQIFGEYIWQPLTKPFTQTFRTEEETSLFKVEISSVGWKSKDDVEFLLDGFPLELEGEYTEDRSFFTTKPFMLKSGEHQLIIRSNGNRPDHILAYANGYVFPESYDFDSGKVKAFNVFDESMRMVGYRPTEHACIMRDMLSKVFCPVDQENIWIQFLQRVSLIDSVQSDASSITLKTIPFEASMLEISWFKGDQELIQYRGARSIPSKERTPSLKVRVKLKTPEIRKASPHLMDEQKVN